MATNSNPSCSRHGDLRAESGESDYLHCFSMCIQHLPYNRSASTFKLPWSISLGVGAEGVVGRKVSLVHMGDLGQRIVRQGIIGWN